jgi:hypothetical protein
LVKANYENEEYGIKSDISVLCKFFRKCLIDNKINLDIQDVLYSEEFLKRSRSVGRRV